MLTALVAVAEAQARAAIADLLPRGGWRLGEDVLMNFLHDRATGAVVQEQLAPIPDVAAVCRAIAADARRGTLAHERIEELRALARD